MGRISTRKGNLSERPVWGSRELAGGVGNARERREKVWTQVQGGRAGSFGSRFLFPSSFIPVKLNILFCREASLDS